MSLRGSPKMRDAIRALLVVCGASLLLACNPTVVRNSVSLIDLDKEWVGLYEQRLKAERENPGTAAAINSRLADLSERAEQHGDASESDPATAAGFYRIAATSAWAAGPPRNTRVLPIRDKGTAVCTKLAADPMSQPRDCAFIRIAPELATLDAQAAAVKTLRDAVTLSAPEFAKAEQVASTMTQVIQRIVQERPTPGAQSTSFDEYIQLNLNRGFCMLPGLVGHVASHSPPPDQMQRIVASAQSAQSALQGANISTACT
ncbi:MAG: hypothetical protein ABW110_04575 [Steroidobacteraceae bacterium]